MAKLGPKTPKIRSMGVTCSNLCRQNYLPLFKEEKRREELIKTVDQINAHFGSGSIYPAIVILTKTMA